MWFVEKIDCFGSGKQHHTHTFTLSAQATQWRHVADKKEQQAKKIKLF